MDAARLLLGLLTGPWTLELIRTLHASGPARVGALKRELEGISAKVLSARLRLLEGAGAITRVSSPDGPTFHVYELTPRGRELVSVLSQLDAVARGWQGQEPQPLTTAGEAL